MQYNRYKSHFSSATALVAVTSFLLSPASAVADESADAVALAKTVVSAGTKSIMSKDTLDAGHVRWTGADTSPPAAPGASVAIVPCPLVLAVCQALSNDAIAAAEAIGWEAITIDTMGDPTATQRAVDAAINREVSCVLTLASPARDIRSQIQRGKEQGVVFVTGFADDPIDYGGDVGFGLDQTAAGALLAAYVVANGGGNVIAFTDPAFPQLAVRINGFKQYIEASGGDAASVLEEVQFSVAGGAQDLITKMQAVLTRHPAGSFDWVVAPYDEALVPILATAQQRDRGEIKGLGFDGAEVALQSIKDGGGHAATINWGLEWVAWAGIDECNRAINGSEVGVNSDFPIQLTHAANVTPGARYDPGYDFKAKYLSLWNVEQ